MDRHQGRPSIQGEWGKHGEAWQVRVDSYRWRPSRLSPKIGHDRVMGFLSRDPRHDENGLEWLGPLNLVSNSYTGISEVDLLAAIAAWQQGAVHFARVVKPSPALASPHFALTEPSLVIPCHALTSNIIVDALHRHVNQLQDVYLQPRFAAIRGDLPRVSKAK